MAMVVDQRWQVKQDCSGVIKWNPFFEGEIKLDANVKCMVIMMDFLIVIV